MSEVNYEKYLVKKPLYEGDCGTQNNRQCSTMTLMSNTQVPETKHYVQLDWINGLPEPNPNTLEQSHTYDEIVLYLGSDPFVSRDLGADIEYNIGGQPIRFNTTTAIFIPKGLSHGPVTWIQFRKPQIQLRILVDAGQRNSDQSARGYEEEKSELPRKTTNFDFEEYVVRSPVLEVGRSVKNRQMPTRTYMSRHQVLSANYYIEYGWITGMPEPNPHVFEHLHNHDEIVIHFGGNPSNPEALGGEIEFCINGQPLTLSTSCGLFIPKGLKHGPLTWKKYSRPHVELTIVFGAGTFKEVWTANAFQISRT
jgi:hypothetical protein